MTNKTILILHGWESNPREHWYKSAKEKFEKMGYTVYTPELPGAYFPKLAQWIEIIASFHPNENWILIGHSLGGVACLKYLENCDTKVGQTIILASPFDTVNLGAINNFFEADFNFKKIRENCAKFDAIYEDNDPAVPLNHGQKFAEKLNCKLTIVKGYTHLGTMDINILENIIK
jgi:predicted alpha/beta hydrolase family esterase